MNFICREVRGDLLSLASGTQGMKCQKGNHDFCLDFGFFFCGKIRVLDEQGAVCSCVKRDVAMLSCRVMFWDPWLLQS